jgi:hypothetical protein
MGRKKPGSTTVGGRNFAAVENPVIVFLCRLVVKMKRRHPRCVRDERASKYARYRGLGT